MLRWPRVISSSGGVVTGGATSRTAEGPGLGTDLGRIKGMESHNVGIVLADAKFFPGSANGGSLWIPIGVVKISIIRDGTTP